VAAIIAAPFPITGVGASSPFGYYSAAYNPPAVRYVPAGWGYNGYPSAPPGMPPGSTWPIPPLAPIEKTVIKNVNINHYWYVGRTWKGYLEVLTSTGSWVANSYGSYDYVIAPADVEQIEITYKVTTKDYEDYLNYSSGLPPITPIISETYTINGGVDTWVEFGELVLETVTPGATL
jgi:hypothetical protein